MALVSAALFTRLILTRRTLLAAAAVSPALLSPPLFARPGAMLTGANLIEDPAAPFGSGKARESFRLLAEAGANMVALIPFFWQAHGSDPNLVRGSVKIAIRVEGARR